MYNKAISRAFTLLLILQSLITSGQTIIKGRVINSLSKDPVEFANVYISNSSIGGITDLEGYFEFESQLTGQLEVRATHVGFTSSSKVVLVEEGQSHELQFKLVEERIELADVAIVVEKDPTWAKNFKRFQRNFLGHERNIQIENAFVLDFSRDKNGNLVAEADEPLQLVNSYLGYKITHELESFTMNKQLRPSYRGYSRFEELVDPKELEKWEENRVSDYRGSLMHFLRALAENKLAEEGFTAYLSSSLREDLRTVIEEVTTEDILSETEKGLVIVTNGQFLKVRYDDGTRSYNRYRFADETFWLEPTKDKIYFSKEGFLLDPLEVIQHGSLADRRFEKELPYDYKPRIQDDRVRSKFNNLFAHLNDYISAYPREKVYLDFFDLEPAPGKILFFDAFLSAGPYHETSPLSNTLYVELIDPNCELVSYSTVRVESGLAKGSLVLPKILYTGEYRIRAYTNWMKNFDPAHYYVQSIQVGNADKRLIQPDSVIFFPTTEFLIAEIDQKLPLQVVNKYDQGVVATVTIFDGKGKEISTIETDANGQGILRGVKFSKGETYAAKVKGRNGPFELPPVSDNGAYLSVDGDESGIEVSIESRKMRNAKALLLAHAHGVVKFVDDVDLSIDSQSISIATEIFDPGMVHFVLLDTDIEVISSIPWFIKDDLQAFGSTYAIADKLKEERGKQQLLHHLMFGSEVEGFNQAVEKDYSERALLTKQWIALPWKEISKRKFTEIEHGVENGLTVSGYITNKSAKKAVKEGTLGLFMSDSKSFIYSELDSKGRFLFNDLNYTDTTKLVFSYVDKKSMEFDIVFDSVEYSFQGLESGNCGSEGVSEVQGLFMEKIENSQFDLDATLLSEVEISARRELPTELQREIGQIYRNPSQTLIPDSLGQFNGTLLDLLVSGRINGLGVGLDESGTQGIFLQSLQNSVTSGIFAMVMLDNVPLADIIPLSGIQANEIAKIDVLRGGQRIIYGSRAFAGVVSIYTKNGRNYAPAKRRTNVQVRRLKGYSVN